MKPPLDTCRRLFAGLTTVIVLLLSACASPAWSPPSPTAEMGEHELTRGDVEAWLDGVVPTALMEGKVPGAVVAVVKDGEVLTTRGYGYADLGSNGTEPVPVDPEKHMFRWASISKIPTSIAVLQLVEQGKVDLDADINTYLDDLTLERVSDAPVTVRHLLTHTAGFEERWLVDDVIADSPKLVFEPGTTPSYSNYGMSLLGELVARVSGQPFPDYVEEHVLRPAGMTRATYRDNPFPADVAERLATGYSGSGEVVPPEAAQTTEDPDGSLTGSGADAAQFMLTQLARDPELLRADTWEQMWRPGLPDEASVRLGADPMGLGYILGSRNGHRFAQHGGALPAFHSIFEIYPDDGIGIFVSLNGNGADGAGPAIPPWLVEQFADRYLPGANPTGDVDPEQAEVISGTYTDTRRSYSTAVGAWEELATTVSITAESNGWIQLGGTQYQPVGDWLWQEVDGNTRLAAVVADGEVRRISFGPTTLVPAQQGKAAMLLVGVLALAAVLACWPLGALTRWRAARAGRPAAEPLSPEGRTARGGALLGLAGVTAWPAVLLPAGRSFVIPPLQEIGLVLIPLHWAGVLALLPAVWDLISVVRRRAGWRRITVASLLVLGLLGFAWWCLTSNALTFRLAF